MSLATLAGKRATHARAMLPKWGCWYADATIDGEHALSGAVDLVIADLKLSGTVLSGGIQKGTGKSLYRIVGGKGGWGKRVKRLSYANDAGVKASTVLGDAAREAGETIDASTIPATTVGASFVRLEDAASAVLDAVAPKGWYVGEDGVTRIGARKTSTLPANVTRIAPVDVARATATLAPESIAAILPGVVVDGLEAVDVLHEVDAKGGLRSTVWGARGTAGLPRGLEAFAAVLDIIDPDRKFRGVTEYVVAQREGKRLTMVPARKSSGMPNLTRVYVRPGVAGCETEVVEGCRVLVGFIEADPARAYVAAFEDPDGGGFVPTKTKIAGGGPAAARVGDSVSVTLVSLPVTGGAGGTVSGTASGTITAGSSKVEIG